MPEVIVQQPTVHYVSKESNVSGFTQPVSWFSFWRSREKQHMLIRHFSKPVELLVTDTMCTKKSYERHFFNRWKNTYTLKYASNIWSKNVWTPKPLRNGLKMYPVAVRIPFTATKIHKPVRGKTVCVCKKQAP